VIYFCTGALKIYAPVHTKNIKNKKSLNSLCTGSKIPGTDLGADS
jgi:hypothetical protein